MRLLFRCCLGSSCEAVYDIDALQGSSGRTHSVAKDFSIRRKSAPSLGISQACAAACACLPDSSSDLWSQRIGVALSSVEAALRCTARLVLFNVESWPWVFFPGDSAADEPDRATVAHLGDVLAQQTDDSTTILRRGKDGCGAKNVVTWPAGQSVMLEPLDVLALLLQTGQPSSTSAQAATATAALLLSWEPTDRAGPLSGDKHGGVTLSVSDLRELRRLAQFLGYGLLGDPQHARYVARVCRHLALMPAAPSLHDLVLTVLAGLQDLVLYKVALHVQPVLAAVHGVASPAVLFARRQAAATGGSLRPCASDTQAQVAALLAASGSVSGAPTSRFSSTNHHLQGAGPADTSSLSIGRGVVNSGGGAPEASRVKATKTSLPHTLLQQAIRANGRALASTVLHGTAQEGNTSGAYCARQCLYDAINREDLNNGSQGSSGRIARTAPQGPRAQLLNVIIPNASAHLLEDQQPCRDLLVCSKLTGGKVASLAMLMEPMSTPVPSGQAGADAADPVPGAPYGNSRTGPTPATATTGGAAGCAAAHGSKAAVGVGGGAAATGSAEADAAACTLQGSEADGSGAGQPLASPRSCRLTLVAMAASGAAAGVASGSAGVGVGVGGVGVGVGGAVTAPPLSSGRVLHQALQRQVVPFQLALYLLSTEQLPAGVLRLVSDELQALLPMFFAAFRTAVGAPDSALGCCQSDWRRLQEQLMGPPPHTSSPIGTTSMGTDAPAPPPLAERYPYPYPAVALESPLNSPLSPPGNQRSPASSRLFRANVAQSPNPYAGPQGQQHASLPPALLASPPLAGSGPGPKPGLNGLAVSQGGGLVRKGALTLIAAQEEAGVPQPYALSTPGSAAAADAGGQSAGGPRSFKASRLMDSPHVDSSLAGSAASLHQRALQSLRLGWMPQVTLEKAEGPSALGMLVTSMRQGLTAACADDREQEAAQAQDLSAVQLLEVLGRGGQGVVFRGTLHGLEAAIKVLTDSTSGGGGPEDQTPAAPARAGAGNVLGEEGEPAIHDSWDELGADGKAGEARMRQAKRGAMEIAVIGTLSHPSIVQVYASFSGVVVVRCQYHDNPRTEMRLCLPGDEMLAGKDPGPLNQVICFEYCDAGTLLSAARKGAFRQPFAVHTNGPAFPALVPLYKSLLEVALALRYLHSRKLAHCDIKAANVLLKSSSRDPRGWTCKLSDFGCARMLTEVAPEGGPSAGGLGFRTAAPVGTLAYMAPECFIKNTLLTAAVDIYSFGVLMWELLMCRTPYAGMSAKEVPRQVIRHNLRPSFHPLAPSDYCALAVRCWAARPERRPSALELVGHLEQLLSNAQAAAGRESAVAAAAAAAKAPPPPSGDRQRQAAANGMPQSQGLPTAAQLRSAGCESPRPLGRQPGTAADASAVQQQPAKGDARQGAPAEPAPAPAAEPPKGRLQAVGSLQPAAGGKAVATEPAVKKQGGCESGNGGGESTGCRVLGTNGDGEASAICLLPFTNPGTVVG